MAIPDGRWMTASFAAIAVLLMTLNAAHPAPVHGINASAIAEASLVEKSVMIIVPLVATVDGGKGGGVYADGTVEVKPLRSPHGRLS